MSKNKLTQREVQAKQSRQKIHDAAVDLFDKKGYEKVTIADICQKAGFTPGAFYTYFKSKDQIYMNRFFEIDDHYEKVMDDMRDEEDPIKKLRTIVTEALIFMDGLGNKVMRVVYSAELGRVNRKPYMDSERRSLYTIVKSIVEEGQEKGMIRNDMDSMEVSQHVINSVRGLMYDWCLKKGSFDLKERGSRLFEVLLKGLQSS